MPPAIAPLRCHGLRARPAQQGAGLPDALMACAVLGLGIVAWLRLPGITAGQLAAAGLHQQAALAAANLADWLHALRASGFDPLAGPTHRVLLPRPADSAAAPDCRAHDCSPEQMAELGWQEWARQSAAQLPGVMAELDCRPAHETALPQQAQTAQPASAAAQTQAVCLLRMRPLRDAAGGWRWSWSLRI